jgi:hypothetical protein
MGPPEDLATACRAASMAAAAAIVPAAAPVTGLATIAWPSNRRRPPDDPAPILGTSTQ